jgi:hypothetical protein
VIHGRLLNGVRSEFFIVFHFLLKDFQNPLLENRVRERSLQLGNA